VEDVSGKWRMREAELYWFPVALRGARRGEVSARWRLFLRGRRERFPNFYCQRVVVGGVVDKLQEFGEFERGKSAKQQTCDNCEDYLSAHNQSW
jgi:hypothetical protein